MQNKVIGSILMILGTSIGAGMLALPVVSAHENFTISLGLLISAWLLMTIGAFSLLEVNLWSTSDTTNMLSMAQATLGKSGKLVMWLVYLFLLYSLICAYLSGLSDITQHLLANLHLFIPRWLATLISLGLFSLIVCGGISTVDKVNRGLMGIKCVAYVLIVALASQHIQLTRVFQGNHQLNNSVFMVMLTSFGYAIIIPSLRGYLNSQVSLLKRVIFWGSLLPLLIYTLWIIVIQGIIPKLGPNGLISMITSAHTNAALMQQIGHVVKAKWIGEVAKLFISICAVTSFLGVSVCLMDFMADGLNQTKTKYNRLLIYALTYLPPLAIVFVAPGIFIHALAYAGIACLILLIIMPLFMLYKGRYQQQKIGVTFLPKSRWIIVSLLFISLGLLGINLYSAFI